MAGAESYAADHQRTTDSAALTRISLRQDTPPELPE